MLAAAPPNTLFVLGGGGESLLPGKLRLCALSSAGDKAEWLSRPSPAHCSIFGRFQREGEPKRDRDQQPDRVAERGELGGDSPRASPTPPPPSIALRSFLRDANPLLHCALGGGGDTRILRPQMPRSPRSVAAGGVRGERDGLGRGLRAAALGQRVRAPSWLAPRRRERVGHGAARRQATGGQAPGPDLGFGRLAARKRPHSGLEGESFVSGLPAERGWWRPRARNARHTRLGVEVLPPVLHQNNSVSSCFIVT